MGGDIAPPHPPRQRGVTIATATETPRAEFTDDIETRFEELGRTFQRMEIEQMKKGEIEARQKLESAKASFARRKAEVEKQIDRARKVSDEAWDDVRETLQTAWDDLAETVDHARRDFAGELEEEETAED